MRLVVIGSGFGGLAAAIRLQAAGHSVLVLEKRDKPGGRAYVYTQDGFSFDGGPTVITAPWLFTELFELAGRQASDYVEFLRVDPFYQILFEDGTSFRYNADPEQMRSEIEKFNPADVRGYERFLEHAKRVFETGFALIDKPFSTFRSMLRVLPDLVRLRADRSVYRVVSQYISDEKLRRVFSFHPLLVGGNPFHTTSIYTLILYLERKWGVWFARGGTAALVKALERLFVELGGEIRLNSEVSRININPDSREANGIQLTDGQYIVADGVVSNADVPFTYRNLISPEFRQTYTDNRIESMAYSMSLFVYYFGTDRQYPDIEHHSIIMGRTYQELLEDIFDNHHLSDDFSLYLHRPTRTDPELAPSGCDAFYVLSPVPNLDADVNWREMAPRYRNRIVQYLEERYLPDLSRHIVTERMIDPLHFRDVLNSEKGSAFSVAPRLTQSAWFRPHNKSEEIGRLWFTGAGTHPGAGLPGVVSSAKIVAEMIGAPTE